MKKQVSMSAALGASLLIIALLASLQPQAQSHTQPIEQATKRQVLTSNDSIHEPTTAQGQPAQAYGLRVNFILLSDHKKVRVVYTNPLAKRINIELRNSANEIIYSEFTKRKAYNRTFNFSGITNNSYTLRIKGADQDFTRAITINQPVAIPTMQMHVPDEPTLQVSKVEKYAKKK